MRSRSCVRVVVGGALLALLAAPRSAHASQEAAKRYFQSGVALITGSDPNYQDAYYQFQLAYQESSKSWKVLGNLGLCALKLERDAEALDYYEQYLKKGGNDIAQEERAAIEQDLLLLRGNLAVVRLTSPVADLQIVDRRAGSTAPAQSYKLKDGVLDLQLRAGSHNLTASSGNGRLSWDVVLEPKASVSHVFDFDAPPPAVVPAAAPAAAAESKPAAPASDSAPARSGTSLRIPAYIALGVGAVGLGVGGYFAWQSADYSKKADDAFVCNPGCSVAQRAIVRDLEDDSSSATTKAVVSFAVGGAAVITGVILLAVSGSSSNDTATASVSPWVGYREAGIAGRF